MKNIHQFEDILPIENGDFAVNHVFLGRVIKKIPPPKKNRQGSFHENPRQASFTDTGFASVEPRNSRWMKGHLEEVPQPDP